MKSNKLTMALAFVGMAAISVTSLAQNKMMSSRKMSMHKASVSKQDKMFMMDAAHTDKDELALVKLAMTNGGAKGKGFAEHMMKDHTTTSEELMPIAKSKGVVLPAGPDAMGKQLMARLKKLKGDAFDKAYLTSQVKAHDMAIMKFQKEANSGSDADVKAFAAKYLPTVKSHKPLAQGLLDGKSMDEAMKDAGMPE